MRLRNNNIKILKETLFDIKLKDFISSNKKIFAVQIILAVLVVAGTLFTAHSLKSKVKTDADMMTENEIIIINNTDHE